ncbi:mogroside IIIx synthase-like [Nicotiana tabacum]|uniref:Mogroside IIIx synthase-like n=1 Tax=Nicotiana tabacum TaxID=4097 RepID=A0AC58UIJ9_TOBAC
MQYLSSITNKKILSVGPLIGQTDESIQDDQDSDIIEWLDKRDPFSTVYAVFGSESVWSTENIQEIAHGIESSNVNFLWVLRFPGSEVEQVLPEGFLSRVKERGMVVSRWVPHAKIMRHTSIGGFLNHCGWNSTVECIHFGVPLIAMPFNMDQFITANYAVEHGMALKVQRDEKGGLKREEIAKAIRNVIMEKKLGEELSKKSKELKYMVSTTVAAPFYHRYWRFQKDQEEGDCLHFYSSAFKRRACVNKNKSVGPYSIANSSFGHIVVVYIAVGHLGCILGFSGAFGIAAWHFLKLLLDAVADLLPLLVLVSNLRYTTDTLSM